MARTHIHNRSGRARGTKAFPFERVADEAFARGLKSSDLFDQAWFDKHCGGR